MEEKMDVYQKAAQFLINVKAKEPREMVCQCLVLSILAQSTNELSVNQTVKAIEDDWKIKVPAGRISRTLKKLESEGSIQKSDKGYFMGVDQKDKYHQSIKNRVSFFKEVEDEWLKLVQTSGACKSLEKGESEQIIGDFRDAVEGLCEKHVEKVICFLNGNVTDLQDVLIGKEVMECIPENRSRTDEIRNIELNIFPLFFQGGNPQRAKYCAGIAQTYMRRTIFELETKGKELFGDRIKSVNVFLDTNLIFGLLGLHGDDEKDTLEKLLEMNRSLGVNVFIDKQSIQEYRSVLGNSRKANIGPRIPKAIFSEVKKAIQNPGYKPTVDFVLPDDSFVLAFWSSLEESYVKHADRKSVLGKWETFLNYLDSVEIILSEKYGVKIVNEFSKVECGQKELDEAIGWIMEAAKRHNVRKSRSTAEHDALMFFNVRRFREDERPELLPSNTWLLSADGSLRDFHKTVLIKEKHVLAHFLPVAAWMELIMPFLNIQLVDDKDNALAVARSMGEGFQYFGVERMPAREVAEVLRRVPETYERGPELVLRLATNRYFKDTIHGVLGGTVSPPKEAIDEAVIKAFEGVEEKAKLVDKDVISEIESIRGQMKRSQEDLESEREARKRAERIIAKLKLLSILVTTSVATAWLGYYLIKPVFRPFEGETGIWILGCAALIAWITLSLRAKVITFRSLLLGLLPVIMVFLAALFLRHWNNIAILGILGTVLVAIVGVAITLIKSSWLDFRIMLR